MVNNHWLVVLWNHGFWIDFPIINWEWNVIIPTDFQSIIFQRGWWLKPPTRWLPYIFFPIGEQHDHPHWWSEVIPSVWGLQLLPLKAVLSSAKDDSGFLGFEGWPSAWPNRKLLQHGPISPIRRLWRLRSSLMFFFFGCWFWDTNLGVGQVGHSYSTARHWLGAADVRGNTSQDAERIQRPVIKRAVFWCIWRFPKSSGYPNPKWLDSLDHDLVVKPMVTTGDPPF